MAILTKEQILDKLRARIGEDTSDEAIQFIEDVTDTFGDFETKVADTTDWKSKYEQNDAEWRKKYRDRFFNSVETGDDPKPSPEATEEEENKKLTYDNLFKEETNNA